MHGVTCTGWHSHRMYTVVNWLVNEVNLLPLLVLCVVVCETNKKRA